MPNLEDQHHDQFLRLYAKHEAALHTFVRSVLPTREDASEALQETIVVLWQKFGEYDSTRDFKNWACGIARYKALALLRDRKRDRHIFDDELVNRLADMAVLHEPQHLTEREALEHCLQKLPVAQRELVLMAYTKGNRMDALATRRGSAGVTCLSVSPRRRRWWRRRAGTRGRLHCARLRWRGGSWPRARCPLRPG